MFNADVCAGLRVPDSIECLHLLTVVEKCKEIIEEKICFQDEQRTHHDSLPEPVIIDLKEGARLVSSHSNYILCIELHK